jgi:hypothetical protein
MSLDAKKVEVPASTAWPLVLALGIALLCAGLVTTAAIGGLGAVLILAGCVGWFGEVLPHERHELASVETVAAPPVAAHVEVERVERVEWAMPELPRARLPLETYPFSAGIKGGLAGGVAMALLAASYGVFSGHGIWYPINLLAAGFFPDKATTSELPVFHGDMLMAAVAVHLICSVLVGLLFSATLPMLPRRPVLFGGLIAPVLWSGLLHSVLDAVNPVLNQRIDWTWFVISQMGFGLVAGIVVSKQRRIRTWQHLPLPIRAGIETPGAMEEREQ